MTPQRLNLNRWQQRVDDWMAEQGLTFDPSMPARYVAPMIPGEPVPTSRPAPTVEDLAASKSKELRAKWATIVPDKFVDARFDDLDPALRGNLLGWAARPRLANLVIAGPVGTGKTYAATAALRYLFGKQGRSVEWLLVSDIVHGLRFDDNPKRGEFLNRLNTVDVLLIDDLGMERRNEWYQELITTIVMTRWVAGLPVVATTNLDADDLADALGARTYSRLIEDVLWVDLVGDDRRVTA